MATTGTQTKNYYYISQLANSSSVNKEQEIEKALRTCLRSIEI